MPRAGLSAGDLVDVASALLDADPTAELSLSRVAAELGVKTPSLYNHVAGLSDLRRSVAMAGIVELGDALRTAVMGHSGPDAVRALALAYRSYARQHPGIYPLTQEARPDDGEYAALSLRAIEPAQATLRSCGCGERELIHRVRAMRSALHGFVLLETQRGFGLEENVDESFEHLVGMLTSACTADG